MKHSILVDTSSANKKAPQGKSFAQVVNNSFDSQLPKPCLKGDSMAIKISESEYHVGVVDCKNILYGRLMLSKGDSPVKINDLRLKLSKIWSTSSSWTMVPLGKGYYEFSFSSLDDQKKVRSNGSWNVNPGV